MRKTGVYLKLKLPHLRLLRERFSALFAAARLIDARTSRWDAFLLPGRLREFFGELGGVFKPDQIFAKGTGSVTAELLEFVTFPIAGPWF